MYICRLLNQQNIYTLTFLMLSFISIFSPLITFQTLIFHLMKVICFYYSLVMMFIFNFLLQGIGETLKHMFRNEINTFV
jgi:hypothetical protein